MGRGTGPVRGRAARAMILGSILAASGGAEPPARTFTLTYLPAASAKHLVEAALGPEHPVSLAADPRDDGLVVTGSAAALARVEGVLADFDVPALAELETLPPPDAAFVLAPVGTPPPAPDPRDELLYRADADFEDAFDLLD